MIDSNKELNCREPNSSEKYYISEFYSNYFTKRGMKYLVFSLLILGLSLYHLFSDLLLGFNTQYTLFTYLTNIPYYLLSFALWLIYRKYKKMETDIHEGNYFVVDVQYVSVTTHSHNLENTSYLQYRFLNQNTSRFDRSAEIPMRALKDRNYDKSSIPQDVKAQVIGLSNVRRGFGVIYL